MDALIQKYAGKLVEQGLAEPGAPVVGGLDAELLWSRPAKETGVLKDVFAGLNINSLVYTPLAEPFASILEFLCRTNEDAIYPVDCETRTFLHDLPIRREFSADAIVGALKGRKSVILPGHGVVTFGTVSPEQAFVVLSSVCFATYVKFALDCLTKARLGVLTDPERELLARVLDATPVPTDIAPGLMEGPFTSSGDVIKAICEVGRYTVDYRLVDSFFGNVSCRLEDTLFISQTGASLDEMEGCIDPCKLDGSSCAAVTASSELTAHREVILRTGAACLLHGHPKFSVILSMACEKENCQNRGECHIRCSEERFLDDIPIVPGEVGTGPRGLCNTLPKAMEGRRGVIVYGHGLFTVGQTDFRDAFANLVQVERDCRDRFVEMVGL